jgi:hypothetical protein
MQIQAEILKFTSDEDALIKSGQFLKNQIERKKFDLSFVDQLLKTESPLFIGKMGMGQFEVSEEKEKLILSFIKGILLEQITATEESINHIITRFEEVSN